jgi:Mob1/phocein family
MRTETLSAINRLVLECLLAGTTPILISAILRLIQLI